MPNRVSARDVAFLAEENNRNPLQVATVAILQPGAGGFDYQMLVDLINERISFVPRYRQRLVSAPLPLARPVWVDDEDFDLTYHVRRSRCRVRGRWSSCRTWWGAYWPGGWTVPARCGRPTSSRDWPRTGWRW
jgi:hypothetical protein